MFFLRVFRLTKVYTCVLCLINIYTELSFFLRFTYYRNYVEIPELSLLNCFDFLLSTVLMCLIVSFKMLLTCSVLHYLYPTTCHKTIPIINSFWKVWLDCVMNSRLCIDDVHPSVGFDIWPLLTDNPTLPPSTVYCWFSIHPEVVFTG